MKALTLTQPFASLIADGRKSIETRGWAPRLTAGSGILPLAIHAAKGWTDEDRALAGQFGYDLLALPRGAVVAICYVARVLPTERFRTSTAAPRGLPNNAPGDNVIISTVEWAAGDYSPGRYGWVLEGVTRVDPPIPATGHLGLWDWVDPRLVP